jgi:hypothetical protein
MTDAASAARTTGGPLPQNAAYSGTTRSRVQRRDLGGAEAPEDEVEDEDDDRDLGSADGHDVKDARGAIELFELGRQHFSISGEESDDDAERILRGIAKLRLESLGRGDPQARHPGFDRAGGGLPFDQESALHRGGEFEPLAFEIAPDVESSVVSEGRGLVEPAPE